MFNDAGYHERQQFILRRDAYGRAEYTLRRWYHGKVFHVLAVIILYLFASSLAYKEEAAFAAERAESAQQRANRAESFRRKEPVVFILEARDLAELEAKLRNIRNAANDNIVHAQAAR